ncbi:hypothetical protein H4582DRAFT_2134458 [Lactarius indigo]|nr:hypothetical protein H4582DRAFT_2134458 [Lactarius indigo]
MIGGPSLVAGNNVTGTDQIRKNVSNDLAQDRDLACAPVDVGGVGRYRSLEVAKTRTPQDLMLTDCRKRKEKKSVRKRSEARLTVARQNKYSLGETEVIEGISREECRRLEIEKYWYRLDEAADHEIREGCRQFPFLGLRN